MTPIDFKNIIIAIQNEKKTTSMAVADFLGITRGNYSRLLSSNDIKLNAGLVRIADALGYDIEIRAINRKTGIAISIDNINRDSRDKSNSD